MHALLHAPNVSKAKGQKRARRWSCYTFHMLATTRGLSTMVGNRVLLVCRPVLNSSGTVWAKAATWPGDIRLAPVTGPRDHGFLTRFSKCEMLPAQTLYSEGNRRGFGLLGIVLAFRGRWRRPGRRRIALLPFIW